MQNIYGDVAQNAVSTVMIAKMQIEIKEKEAIQAKIEANIELEKNLLKEALADKQNNLA